MTRLMDNDATASLTDRERRLLTMLGRCLQCLTALAYSRYIGGDDTASADMRSRVAGLQRATFNLIDSDDTMRNAMYATGVARRPA